ncbi:DUF885 domain-containing protein [Cellulomonas chengniuliangii]|uniref:DUF885 domain-containing protein n=1 Tax=Cellulomonas chengniuliangii TaxID=2968084 RepID=A0ABY5L292_9CELL|nr:DUF885 domain-containing protein [Cellulomonas chengniuliangii]MCC2310141.1 DUF885 domain-containing protein [Cellulomonas chengniuliangii]MCC2316380.1 DUF885 domain-containing protein [Cellulomonas chengniuliangii]UUI76910.1 DUF885 domain-containing protein [Cellulomonas chengniuliangii]
MAAQLDPLDATSMGIAGHDHEMTDLSPAGHEARAEASRATLVALDAHAPSDSVDEVTVAAMRERLGLELELHEAGELLASLNNIASPVQALRDVFDIMPTGDPEAWENIAARLNALPGAVDGYVESLREAASRGRVAAVRQVREAVAQAAELADPSTSFFTGLVQGPTVDAALDGSAACQAIRGELELGAQAARQAYATLTSFLSDELAPQAPQADAAGRERYSLWSRYFLGSTVDLEETYQWGLEELARVIDEQERVAAQISGPGATVEQAVADLDADPALVLHGTQALQAWMQETSDAAIAALDGVHFDIPGPVRTLECMIAPTQNGGIYYTGPSDDFTRPGRMWWSVPPEVTTFNTWREKTTVYHEGVPGHHLQVGQAVHSRATLNSWRRLGCWVSGHGEGWALYAERLMADLGFLDAPGDRLGMLDGQRMRAARVVLDIGVHLGLPAPARWGGGTWDADKAWEFLRANVNMPEQFVRFELNRYLGWPGQAPSYKIGQRLWEQARDDAATAAAGRGEVFDLRQFHARALGMGALPLDVLRSALV